MKERHIFIILISILFLSCTKKVNVQIENIEDRIETRVDKFENREDKTVYDYLYENYDIKNFSMSTEKNFSFIWKPMGLLSNYLPIYSSPFLEGYDKILHSNNDKVLKKEFFLYEKLNEIQLLSNGLCVDSSKYGDPKEEGIINHNEYDNVGRIIKMWDIYECDGYEAINDGSFFRYAYDNKNEILFCFELWNNKILCIWKEYCAKDSLLLDVEYFNAQIYEVKENDKIIYPSEKIQIVFLDGKISKKIDTLIYPNKKEIEYSTIYEYKNNNLISEKFYSKDSSDILNKENLLQAREYLYSDSLLAKVIVCEYEKEELFRKYELEINEYDEKGNVTKYSYDNKVFCTIKYTYSDSEITN